jgi:pimeloyl-ACP methyl ester carboxylesterase
MQTIEISGTKLAYMSMGAGEPVVQLHGSASSSRQWLGFGECLGQRFHVMAPDLYGYGESDPWPGKAPLTLSHEAELAVQVMSGRGGRVHLVGHSFGGAVALRLALDHPGLIASLTLIEPVAFHVLERGCWSDRAMFAEIRALARSVADATFSGDAGRGMARFVDYWNGPGTWARAKSGTREILTRCADKVTLDFSTTTREDTPLGAYRGLNLPTLVLRGSDSPLVTRRIAELLVAVMPDARLRTLEGAGHMSPMAHPDMVNAAIAEHLSANAVSRQAAA